MQKESSVSFPVIAIVGFPRARSRVLEIPERPRERLANLGKKGIERKGKCLIPNFLNG